MKWFLAKLKPGITRGAASSVIILFIVVIALTGVSYVLTSRAIIRGQHNSASITQLCQSGNEFRREQIRLWQFVISLSGTPPHETAAQKRARVAELRTFNAYLHRVFAPRTCDGGSIHTAK